MVAGAERLAGPAARARAQVGTRTTASRGPSVSAIVAGAGSGRRPLGRANSTVRGDPQQPHRPHQLGEVDDDEERSVAVSRR